MKIEFYKTASERNRLEKVLTNKRTIKGTTKASFDLVRPVIPFMIHTTQSFEEVGTGRDFIPDYNYCYLTFIKRWYFIDSIEITQRDIITLSLSLDPLFTYREQIRGLKVIAREAKDANPYYNGYNTSYDVRTEYDIYRFKDDAFNEDGEVILIGLYGTGQIA